MSRGYNEKVRLIHEQDDTFEEYPYNQNRRQKILRGASNIMSRWPKQYLFIVLGCCITFSAIIIVSFIIASLIQMTLIRFKLQLTDNSRELCKRITEDNSSILLEGFLNAEKENSELYINPSSNVFYVLKHPITEQQACAIESALQLMSDKFVYVIEFIPDNGTRHTNDYITILQKRYKNLNRIQTNINKYLTNSLFHRSFNKSNDVLKMYAAKLLMVWNFGGLVLSEDLLMNSKGLVYSDNFQMNSKVILNKHDLDTCVTDVNLLFCPRPCAAFTYELMRKTLESMNSTENVTDLNVILNSAMMEFCHSDNPKVSCKGVFRLSEKVVCDDVTEECAFVRARNLPVDNNYTEVLHRFCPYTVPKTGIEKKSVEKLGMNASTIQTTRKVLNV